MQLNPQQDLAVKYLDGPLLVLAGAGSGKTRVITEKIAYLLKVCGVPASAITAVTFTNKAAREMRERLAKRLPIEISSQLRISTFHTLGLSILRQEIQHTPLQKGFSIFDDQDTQQLLRELLKNEKDHLQACSSQISKWKNTLQTPDKVVGRFSDIYLAYDRQLRAYNAVDFDDLISLPALLFQTHPQVLQVWQERIRYLLVDEYQDTNAAQYHLVKLLMTPRAQFTVVGDDDQSIYSWRGAMPENLRLLKEDFPNLKVIALEQNYRSTKRILRAANQVIAKNPHDFVKHLWSDHAEGEKIRVIQAEDDVAEANQVAAEILASALHQKAQLSDFAILYRSNHQAREIEKALRAHRLAYQISGGLSFFSRSEVKDVMAYLRLIMNPQDDSAFLRVVNTPKRGMGIQTLEKLGQRARHLQTSLLAACMDNEMAKLQQFADEMQLLRQQCETKPVHLAVLHYLQHCGYPEWLAQTFKRDEADARMANVEEILRWLKDAEEKSSHYSEAIAKVCLQDGLEKDATDLAAIQCLTLHAAKGLEFPNVFLIGSEENILPHHSVAQTDDVAEERRLFYVGITRAQTRLTLLLTKTRQQRGKTICNQASRFLAELPQEDVHWQGQASAEPTPQSATTHLSALRQLLKT